MEKFESYLEGLLARMEMTLRNHEAEREYVPGRYAQLLEDYDSLCEIRTVYYLEKHSIHKLVEKEIY